MANQDILDIADDNDASLTPSSTNNSDNDSQALTQNSIQNSNQMADKWKSNPLQGNFNPGSKIGMDIFLEKNKVLPENQRLDLTRTNVEPIH